MNVQSDPVVRLETVAAAANLALFSLRRRLAAGEIPPADITLPGKPSAIRAWRLSTVRAWNPSVAARCAVIAAALDAIPLKKQAA